MKVECVTESNYEIVEFIDEQNIYERYGKGNWGVRMGESVESILIPDEIKELDDAYSEYLNQDDDKPGERKRLTTQDLIAYQKRLDWINNKEELVLELQMILDYLNKQCNPKQGDPSGVAKVSVYMELHGILGQLMSRL